MTIQIFILLFQKFKVIKLKLLLKLEKLSKILSIEVIRSPSFILIFGVFTATGAAAYPVALAAGFAERLADRVYARTDQGCAELAAGSLGVEDI